MKKGPGRVTHYLKNIIKRRNVAIVMGQPDIGNFVRPMNR